MPLWILFSSLLWDPTLSWLLSPWFLLFCLLCWFFLGSSTDYPGVILEFRPMFSSPYPPPPPWALHQLVALYAFHTLMTPKCTFQSGPFPELQACIQLQVHPSRPTFLASCFPSSFPFFFPNSFFSLSLSFYPKSHITSVICAHKLMRVCETALQRRAVRNRKQFHTLQKRFAKGFLEMLHSPGAYRKRFWFINPFLLCFNATLKNMLNFCFKFCPIQPIFSQVLSKSWVLRLAL